jgi:uncharacterized protein YjbJ (UPF0337 family)
MSAPILEGNWDEIKGKLKQKWGKLTNDDIKVIEGSYGELQGKLQKAYGYKKAEVEHEIESFLEELNLSNEAMNFKEAILRNARLLKDKAEQFYHDSSDELHELKDKTVGIQKEIVSYVKKNPGTSLGIAAFAGLIAGIFLKKK